MEVIRPPRLNRGDTVGVITPGSPMIPERLAKGIDYLKGLGYKVVEGQSAYRKRGYLAGTDEQRAADINVMFGEPSIKAIFCSRGGYGTSRLLDLIDYELVRRNPKILVGYSDLTALELALWRLVGLVTFSGPMVAVEMSEGIDQFTAGQLWRILTANGPIGSLPLPGGTGLKALAPGRVRGRILGGCLSMINPLLGTKYVPDFAGAIMVLEDVDEEPYRLDRYLAQLRSAGVLKAVGGIVFGNFIGCVPADPQKPFLTVDEIIRDYTANLGVPVVAGLAYGHGGVKVTLPIGVETILDADQGTLQILESAVA